MSLTLAFPNTATRLATLSLLLLFCGWLAWLVLAGFIVDTFTEEGSLVSRDTLVAARQRFPASARVAARLAAAALADAADDEAALPQAVEAAEAAITRCPQNAQHHVLAALAKSLQGEQDAVGFHFASAYALAPYDRDIRWRLANHLLRSDQVDASLEHFRYAVNANPAWLLQALDLLWQITDGNLGKLAFIAGEAPKARLELAQFLLEQEQTQSAIHVLSAIDRTTLLALPETTAFFGKIMQKKDLSLARQCWSTLLTGMPTPPPLVWDGGFEAQHQTLLKEFDWKIKDSQFVRVTVDPEIAHTGKHSLRLQFLGRDTTHLTDEVQQLVILQSGMRYRLECFVKTKDLTMPETPRFILLDHATAQVLETSSPLPLSQDEWQRFAFTFQVPANAANTRLVLQRIPKLVYDEPARGSLWLDDMSLTQL